MVLYKESDLYRLLENTAAVVMEGWTERGDSGNQARRVETVAGAVTHAHTIVKVGQQDSRNKLEKILTNTSGHNHSQEKDDNVMKLSGISDIKWLAWTAACCCTQYIAEANTLERVLVIAIVWSDQFYLVAHTNSI